ncbi:MAG: HD family hydrolase [Methanopyri archaeon]|nr:HD family hydrolase [Methanopyri archaeon]
MTGLVEAVYRLKKVPRTGWLVRGVPRCSVESVAEHSFGAAVLAWEMARRLREKGVDVDPCKAVLVALFHDLPEALALDLDAVASRIYGRDVKSEAERRAAEEIFDEETKGFWEEYEECETPEGKVAKLADLADMAIQAVEYSKSGFERWREFVESALEGAREIGGPYEEVFLEILEEAGVIDREGGGGRAGQG